MDVVLCLHLIGRSDEKLEFLLILWIWLITGCHLPIDRIENNYYLKVLEVGDKLYTCGEIVEKWTWDEKDYYTLHVNAVQNSKFDKIHGDAIGGKEVNGNRSIATLTQSVGIPIYDKNSKISDCSTAKRQGYFCRGKMN